MRLPFESNENQDNTYSVLSEENSIILKNRNYRKDLKEVQETRLNQLAVWELTTEHGGAA